MMIHYYITNCGAFKYMQTTHSLYQFMCIEVNKREQNYMITLYILTSTYQ